MNPQMMAATNQPGPAPSGAIAPPPAAPSPSDVEQLQDRYIQLDARAQAALRGVESIRRQQEATGLGLRGDIESADSRLRSYMAAANQDVHGPRTAQAARDMDKAESEISILEKFLGR
jgi:serine/threonine-protein kinase